MGDHETWLPHRVHGGCVERPGHHDDDVAGFPGEFHDPDVDTVDFVTVDHELVKSVLALTIERSKPWVPVHMPAEVWGLPGTMVWALGNSPPYQLVAALYDQRATAGGSNVADIPKQTGGGRSIGIASSG
jgi:hypothetical protein